jgi:hypothetical protein
MWTHHVARTSTPHEPFRDFRTAQWFWNHLRVRFPQALGAILMPNHLHLILPFNSVTSEIRDRAILTGLMGALSRRLEIQGLWQPLSEPKPIPDRFHLRRNLRYVALNPCRRSLCSDPLEWPWSTYRDLYGSSVDQWVSMSRIVQVLREKEMGFEDRFHSYVSSDPTVAIQGTSLPKAAFPRPLAEEGVLEILMAASAALRMPALDVRRKGELRLLFIHLARLHGWGKPAVLAEICGVSPRAIHMLMNKRPSPRGVKEAALCLGDRRLRRGVPDFFAKEEESGHRDGAYRT